MLFLYLSDSLLFLKILYLTLLLCPSWHKLCCGRSHNAFEPMQVISSLSNGGGPHKPTSRSHAMPLSKLRQLHHQIAPVWRGGASLRMKQERRHMHTIHYHPMEVTPFTAHVATPGIGDPSAGGSKYHHISADDMTTLANSCPPNRVWTMLPNQYLCQSGISQSGGKVREMTGTNPILMSHQNTPSPPHHGGLCTRPHGVGIDLHSYVGPFSRGLSSSNHSVAINCSNSGSAEGMMHTAPAPQGE